MTHHYEVHHVSDKEYENHNIGERFKGGTVINGISGVNDEALLVTVVSMDAYPEWDSNGIDFISRPQES